MGVGAYPRNKTPDIGGGGVLGVESPWLGSGGNMFVRNVTPDLGFARNVTPDIGGGNMFGGSGVMSSSRKLQDVLAALSSIRSVRIMNFYVDTLPSLLHVVYCTCSINMLFMHLLQDDANAPASLAPAAIGSDDLPVQGAGWTPVEEDALDEQVCNPAFQSRSCLTFFVLCTSLSQLFYCMVNSFQELKVAFARSRKVADMQSEAQLSLAVSLAMCR